MKKQQTAVYIIAWLAYVTASFLLYPYLRVTVMLLSIPLTMLGAWFYLYKGAVLTTLLTIPYHAWMLHQHTDTPAILIEALNPLGISTQLFFSCWTALLRRNMNRYHELTNSLENIVEEQTADLRLFTEHLMAANEIEESHVIESLLDKPRHELSNMLETSNLLLSDFKKNRNPAFLKAEKIAQLVESCMKHLETIATASMPTTAEQFLCIEPALKTLAGNLQYVAGVNINLTHGPWDELPREAVSNIYQIIHESLTNALRHANPTQIKIGIVSGPLETTVYVKNNGTALHESNGASMGISLMKLRAKRIGANLSIDSDSEEATVVRCSLPRTGGFVFSDVSCGS